MKYWLEFKQWTESILWFLTNCRSFGVAFGTITVANDVAKAHTSKNTETHTDTHTRALKYMDANKRLKQRTRFNFFFKHRHCSRAVFHSFCLSGTLSFIHSFVYHWMIPLVILFIYSAIHSIHLFFFFRRLDVGCFASIVLWPHNLIPNDDDLPFGVVFLLLLLP